MSAMKEKLLLPWLYIYFEIYLKKVIPGGVKEPKQNPKARYHSFLSSDIYKRGKQTSHDTWVVE